MNKFYTRESYLSYTILTESGFQTPDFDQVCVSYLCQLEMAQGSSSSKQWRKSNLMLEIPTRSLEASRQEFVHINMPSTPTPTPKRVNFLLTPSPSRLNGSSDRGRSSIRNILPKLIFKQSSSNSDSEKGPINIDSTAQHNASMTRTWSLTKIFTPRMKTTTSLPVTPISNLNLDSSRGGSANCPPDVSRS